MMDPIVLKDLPISLELRVRNDQPFEGFYHSHQAAEFLYVHEGKGKIVVNRKTYDIQPQSLFYFPPFQLHRVHADIDGNHPYVRTIVHYLPAGMERCLASFPQLHEFHKHLYRDRLQQYGGDAAFVGSYLESTFDYYGERFPCAYDAESEERLSLFFSQLLHQLRTCFHANEMASFSPGSRRGRYSETIMQWVELHYKEDFHLDELAQSLHLSKYYVSRIFREETSGNITDYIMARRMKEACSLLHSTSRSVEWIGMEVGVKNSSYFCQQFKRMVGVTPHQYRKQNEPNKSEDKRE